MWACQWIWLWIWEINPNFFFFLSIWYFRFRLHPAIFLRIWPASMGPLSSDPSCWAQAQVCCGLAASFCHRTSSCQQSSPHVFLSLPFIFLWTASSPCLFRPQMTQFLLLTLLFLVSASKYSQPKSWEFCFIWRKFLGFKAGSQHLKYPWENCSRGGEGRSQVKWKWILNGDF